eukprot:3745761-Prorocentrum_lima.AAC.1
MDKGMNTTAFASRDSWRVIEWDLTLPSRLGVDTANLHALRQEFPQELDCVVDGDFFPLRKA